MLTLSTSDVLCALDTAVSSAPVVTAASHWASTELGTPNVSVSPTAIPPVSGSVATGDCVVTPSTFT